MVAPCARTKPLASPALTLPPPTEPPAALASEASAASSGVKPTSRTSAPLTGGGDAAAERAEAGSPFPICARASAYSRRASGARHARRWLEWADHRASGARAASRAARGRSGPTAAFGTAGAIAQTMPLSSSAASASVAAAGSDAGSPSPPTRGGKWREPMQTSSAVPTRVALSRPTRAHARSRCSSSRRSCATAEGSDPPPEGRRRWSSAWSRHRPASHLASSAAHASAIASPLPGGASDAPREARAAEGGGGGFSDTSERQRRSRLSRAVGTNGAGASSARMYPHSASKLSERCVARTASWLWQLPSRGARRCACQ
mmetsp:Transcript_8610/g.27555  ORF Transcript_8610/g.27555 Transcript_8610/m.27555 type:complete len:318 (+) Transcript_8610:313-1266(+)